MAAHTQYLFDTLAVYWKGGPRADHPEAAPSHPRAQRQQGLVRDKEGTGGPRTPGYKLDAGRRQSISPNVPPAYNWWYGSSFFTSWQATLDKGFCRMGSNSSLPPCLFLLPQVLCKEFISFVRMNCKGILIPHWSCHQKCPYDGDIGCRHAPMACAFDNISCVKSPFFSGEKNAINFANSWNESVPIFFQST